MNPYYPVVRKLAQLLLRLSVPVRLEGREYIPSSGPALLIANHQSALDPICLQAHVRRTVHSMTKSSQFQKPIFGWLLPRLHAFPTRRYRVDPQAVRHALRMLDAGEVVCIYGEGERTWTGELHPLRLGTVRLALRAGVPIVPCGVSGAFRAKPRWGEGIRRAPIVVRFGPPLDLGVHRTRPEREAALPEAKALIEESIRKLVHLPSGPTDRATGTSYNPSNRSRGQTTARHPADDARTSEGEKEGAGNPPPG